MVSEIRANIITRKLPVKPFRKASVKVEAKIDPGIEPPMKPRVNMLISWGRRSMYLSIAHHCFKDYNTAMDGSQEITQTLPSIPPREKPLIMIMGEPTYIPKYESSIPRQVTDRILQKEQLRVELPGLGSSIIEDYLIEQVKGGVIDSEEIAANFERQNIGAKVRAFAERARRTSESLDWSETFTLDDARIAQVKIVAEMQNMGMTPDQIAAVAKMDVEIGEGIGVSSLSEHGVYVSRLQAVRKAIDYQELYGSDIPLQTIVRAIMTNTIGHELGHKVDDVASVAINRIRADDSWKKGDDSGER